MNIKPAPVASNVLGVSGRVMVEAITTGRLMPTVWLSWLVARRNKIPELKDA